MTDIPENLEPVDRHRIMACLGYDLKTYCDAIEIDLDSMTRALSMNRGKFRDHSATVGYNKFCRLLEALASIAGDDCFGLRYSLHYTLGHVGPFSMGLSTAPTVREMLKFLVRYGESLGNFSILNIDVEDNWSALRWRASPYVARNVQFTDLVSALFIDITNGYTQGEPFLSSAQFERRPPRDVSIHNRIFGKKLIFDASYNEFKFPVSVLDKPNPCYDEVTFKYMSMRCEGFRTIQNQRQDFVSAISEDLLANLTDGDCSVEAVARRQGMSERTMQRRLESLDTSFSKVFEAARDQYSLQLLAEPQLALSSIAEKLGYSSQSAYTRAVRRRHNLSPNRLRKALLDV